MARIRTIKPEFWEDEKIGLLSFGARLLFLGMLNHSDDEGLIRWNEMYLISSIFPYDNVSTDDIKKWMLELESQNLVFPYIGGLSKQRLCYIINFLKHQRIDKPQQSKLPPPSLQNKEVKEMYAYRDDMICQICNCEVELNSDTNICGSKAISIDHIKPRINGGSDYPSNLRLSHLGCNKSRQDTSDESYNGSSFQERFNLIDNSNSQNNSKNDSKNNSKPEWNSNKKVSDVKVTRKQSVFIPPSLDEVILYFKENNYSDHAAKKMFQSYSVANWVDSKGNPVKNWKQKAVNVWFTEDNKIKNMPINGSFSFLPS